MPPTKPAGPRGCTAHNRAGDLCGGAAVSGTHLCRMHGGTTPQLLAKVAEARELEKAARAVKLFGGPLDVHPAEALLQLVGWKAAEVAYWRQQVADRHTGDTLTGLQLVSDRTGADHGKTWERTEAFELQQLHKAEADLARYAKAAHEAGVADHMVALRQEQAQQAVEVVRAALADPRLAIPSDLAQTVLLDTLRRIAEQP